MFEFTEEEIKRYSRQIILKEVGGKGQKKLRDAKVLIIGAGGLGSPSSIYLAAAGVGTIGMVDFDVVDISNLQRQILHGTKDIGRDKIDSARDTLIEINPNVTVNTYKILLSPDNVLDLLKEYDLVVDGTDNFPTRYLVNDACVILNKPLFYGSVFRFEGQVSVFIPHETACYRCVFPERPPEGFVPSCAEGGVLGIVPGIIGLMQSNEVIKYIVGIGELLKNRLLIFDALHGDITQIKLERDPKCVVCGDSPTIKDVEMFDYGQVCI